jgi:soluble lytic murein transglycosylase
MIATRLARALLPALALAGAAATPLPARAQAQAGADTLVLEARDALRRKENVRLAAAATALAQQNHPLAPWAAYWELFNRLPTSTQADLDAFYARWGGTYVEDRLRNDWLLELGKRRDWTNFAAEFPRFRMNDDREVTCHSLVVAHRAGQPVREAALAAWLAQREPDDGCHLLAATLFDAKVFTAADVWRKARAAADAGRPRTAQKALGLIGAPAAANAAEAFDSPARFLAKARGTPDRTEAELAAIALVRMAAGDAAVAATQMDERWARALPHDLAAWTWAAIAKRSAMDLSPDAADHFQQAERRAQRHRIDMPWPDDALAWKVRAALRADAGRSRWKQVLAAIELMPPSEQDDHAWAYWKARALTALARGGIAGDPMREQAQQLLGHIAGRFDFYGQLASEALGQSLLPPPKPAPLTPEERAAAAAHPGLQRALQLITLGLRSEGVREWNFSLRGMGDRELLAAAQLACDREVWDRCINTSDRTRAEFDFEQRFPLPFRADVEATARSVGVDAATMYGLIRQESRFILDARSGVGASGLMQIMPATARWTAKKLGLDYKDALITDRDLNLRLGASYLKLVLDDFGGSVPMAAAAYNAGPGRPRKWREGPVLEPAVWAENIPFNETRDYVKKVLSNAVWYGARLGAEAPSLKARLGGPVGPRGEAAAAVNRDLP